MKTTRTYAKLPVPEDIYNEIKEKLTKAGYEHAFLSNGCIDMHGIALEKAEPKKEDKEFSSERAMRYDSFLRTHRPKGAKDGDEQAFYIGFHKGYDSGFKVGSDAKPTK